MPRVVAVTIPEYSIDKQPDYAAIGAKIDMVIENNFEGYFLDRALSLTDHPQLTLEQLVKIITETGSDKYDPQRRGVEHEKFAPYNCDLQAGEVWIEKGKLLKPYGSKLVKLFYENVLLDRGYRLRIDLILLYDPKQMVRAEMTDLTKPRVDSYFEKYLWRFKYQDRKQQALVGMVKILK